MSPLCVNACVFVFVCLVIYSSLTTNVYAFSELTTFNGNGNINSNSVLDTVDQQKEDYTIAHSSTMHSIDGYILRSPFSSAQQQQQPQMNHAYYRFQPHSAASAIPLLQHSHGLLASASTPVSESLALSIVNSHLEPNSYYSSSPNGTYSSNPNTILHHSHQASSDLMTNAFTYNVAASSSSTGLYPISDLVTISGTNSSQRTYTEIGSSAEMTHHVTPLGPMLGCIDSMSSSTSDKTAEVDEEWNLPKHHSLLLGRNCPLGQQAQQPYMTYVRSNEVIDHLYSNLIGLWSQFSL